MYNWAKTGKKVVFKTKDEFATEPVYDLQKLTYHLALYSKVCLIPELGDHCNNPVKRWLAWIRAAARGEAEKCSSSKYVLKWKSTEFTEVNER